MTNEEAIQWLDAIKKYYIHGGDEAYDKKRMKAIDMAIKALESKPMEKFDDVKTHIQRLAGDYKCWDNRLTWEETLELNRMLEAQPSEDCISRQAVIDVINFEDEWLFDAKSHNADTKIAFSSLESRVKALPSVTPQRPRGKWINKFGKEQGYDIAGIKTWYIQIMCDKCGFIKTAIEGHTGQYKYCPNCGAEMSGGVEDEVSD